MKEFCEGCRFWARTQAAEGVLGHCRQRPPTFHAQLFVLPDEPVLVARRMASVFPVTREGDWCGAFEAQHSGVPI